MVRTKPVCIFQAIGKGRLSLLGSIARPKGTSTKVLVRCHKDFDTCHEDYVELYYSFISGRRYIGPAFICFEGPFCS